MVLHTTVEKLTTWKAPLLLSLSHCLRKCLFSPKIASRKVLQINVLNNIIHTLLSQAKRSQEHKTVSLGQQYHTYCRINLSIASTSSVLPQATGYATDTRSLLTMGRQHCPLYGVPAYISVLNYPPHVPPAAHMYHPGLPRCRIINRLLLPSRSNQS